MFHPTKHPLKDGNPSVLFYFFFLQLCILYTHSICHSRSAILFILSPVQIQNHSSSLEAKKKKFFFHSQRRYNEGNYNDVRFFYYYYLISVPLQKFKTVSVLIDVSFFFLAIVTALLWKAVSKRRTSEMRGGGGEGEKRAAA